jgi:hypothetical protein
MKKLMMILTLVVITTLFSGCAIMSNLAGIEPPNPTYGHPDDVTNYSSGDFTSITYIYYCHDGVYIAETWNHSGGIGFWERSLYTSAGICNKTK